MIVTVTLNAAVDITYTVENYTLDRVHRPISVKTVAGGKGINVARVLKTLGRDVLAVGFAAGYNGGLILSGLDEEHLPHDFVRISGESRLCIAVVDPVNRTQTEVNEVGPEVNQQHVKEMRDKILSVLPDADCLVLSGSAPPGVPNDFYAWAISVAREQGVISVLDTSGEYLLYGIDAKPDIVKPNVSELSQIVGRELNTVEETLEAALGLVDRGIEIVAVTMGRSGALAADSDEAWLAVPPEIEFVSAVGSGDSFLAAFIDAKMRGEALPVALAAGTAAGAANAMVYGAGFCPAELIKSLEPDVQVSRLK